MKDRDPSRIYRDTSSEDTSPEIDAVILAAAHREVKAKPRRFAMGSWGVPLSAAAVLLVSATLTLIVLDEPESPVASPPASEDKALAKLERQDQVREGLGDLKAETAQAPKKDRATNEPSARFETRAKSAPAGQAAPSAPEMETDAIARLEEDSPEKWLGRIEKLRTEGRVEEAEKNLARFKERYPDYLLPDWAKEE
ncbi:MAG: hypothetical protein ACREV9_02815 [Burkholderiales bacterium]